MSNSLTLSPVFEIAILSLCRLPVRLARVGILCALKPSRLVRWQLALLSLTTRLTLVVFQVRLEIVGVFKFALLESVLIWSKSTISRRQPRSQVGIVVVQSDSEWRAARDCMSARLTRRRKESGLSAHRLKGMPGGFSEFFHSRMYSDVAGMDASGLSSP